MSQHDSIEFSFVRISTDQFAVIDSNYNSANDRFTQFSAEIQFGSSKDDRLIVVTCRYEFSQKEQPFLLLVASMHFQVGDATWESFKQGESYIIPKDFGIHLGILTVGTSRGIMHSKTEGTPFNKFTIPMINLLEIVKDDVRVYTEAAREQLAE
jgi:hypothetical protein